MTESQDTRFKPADRRWNLFGMVIGTAVGALPAAIPEPVGTFVNWIAIGILVGFMFPFYAMVHHFNFDDIRNPKKAWSLGGFFAGIGGLAGAIAWLSGASLEPGMGIGATCSGGFFAGFLIIDRHLRHVDARRREEERLWERPDSK